MIVLAVSFSLALCACLWRCGSAFRSIAAQLTALVGVTRDLGRKVDAIGRGSRTTSEPIGYRLTVPSETPRC